MSASYRFLRRVARAAFLLVLAATFNLHPSTAFAQGTAFTYQGRLNDGAGPATGIYDLRYTIYDALSGGSAVAGPITNSATGVTNGTFTVTLDFGAGVFTGPGRWLELGVRTNGAVSFVTLNPREAVLPQPYAIFAGASATSASYSGAISVLQLPPSVALLNGDQTFSGIVSFSNPSNSFAGNGGGLTGVPWSLLNGQGAIQPSDANFLPATPVVPPDSGFFPWILTTADVDGDGRMDVIAANQFYDHTITVLTNSGNGSLGVSCVLTLSSDVSQLATADFNGDAKVDLAAVTSSTLSVYTNDGSGHFTLSTSPAGELCVAAGDLNGDGKADLVTAGPFLTVLTNNGSGTFTTSWTSVGAATSVALADINSDSKTDLVCVAGQTLNAYTNRGDGVFALASTATVTSNALFSRFVLTADLNGDGKPDAVVANQMSPSPPVGSTLLVLTNNGSGGFVPSYYLGGELAFQYQGYPPVAAADVDGDGRVDLVTANGYTNSLYVLRNTGNGSFAVSDRLIVGVSGGWSGPPSVALADLNGDGRPDLLAPDPTANALAILTNSTRIDFQEPVRFTGSTEIFGPAVMTNAANNFAGTFAGAFSGNFSGDGSGVTNLSFANVAGPLPDAKIPTSVASRTSTNTFAAIQSFKAAIQLDSAGGFSQSSVGEFHIDAPFRAGGRLTVLTNGNVGINTNNPSAALDVNGTARVEGVNNWDVSNTEGDFRVGNNTQRFKIGVATSGGGAGDVWMRAQGGTQRIFVKAPGSITIYSDEAQLNGVTLAAGGGAWTSVSDRNAKENFTPVNGGEILEKVATLPISSWNYKAQDAAFRHLGPMAQDFMAAFGLGESDRGITTVDEEGVALAAIQGLNQKTEARSQRAESRIQALEEENGDLKRQNRKLEERLEAVEQILRNAKTN